MELTEKQRLFLESDVRSSIYDSVCRRPKTITDAAKSGGISHSTAKYHIELLEEQGLVETERSGRTLYVFKARTYGPQVKKIYIVTRHPRTEEVMNYVYEQGTVETVWAIAKKFGKSVPTINWHLKRLHEAGAISIKKVHRAYIITANKDAIEAYREMIRHLNGSDKPVEGVQEAAPPQQL